jgi:hypothetical protein
VPGLNREPISLGHLNFGHCDLPFDSFDHEALDRLAQGGESFDSAQDREPVERLVEPFGIWYLCFGISGLSGLGSNYEILA